MTDTTAPWIAGWPNDLAAREYEQSGEVANDDDALTVFKRTLAQHVPTLDPTDRVAIVFAAVDYGAAQRLRGIRDMERCVATQSGKPQPMTDSHAPQPRLIKGAAQMAENDDTARLYRSGEIARARDWWTGVLDGKSAEEAAERIVANLVGYRDGHSWHTNDIVMLAGALAAFATIKRAA